MENCTPKVPSGLSNSLRWTISKSKSDQTPLRGTVSHARENSLSRTSSFFKSFALALVMLVVVIGSSWGQVGGANATLSYVSTQTTSTYTSITGGTQHYATTAVATNGVTAAVNIGFNFNFNGRSYSQVFISNNGFITFGVAPSTTNYTPLSNTTAPVNYEGAISGMGSNLVNSTATGASAEVRSELIGAAPNRIFVIQYKDVKVSLGSANQRLTFQIQLKENGNVIDIVYGPNNASGTGTWTGQVGVRGSDPSDYSNRTGTNWTTATTGTFNSSTMTIGTTNGTTVPASTLCFRFTPPAAMAAPTYAALPYAENFDVATWPNGTWLQSLPSTASVRTWPGRGDNSWRRNDVTVANSGWTSVTGGYTVASPASGGTARFHTYDTRATINGVMDFYLNFSTAGSKVLTFNYFNANGTDNLVVELSTNGGATFGAALTTVTTSATWSTQTVQLGSSTSTTCVLRLRATSDYGTTDIGLDNVSITVQSCATPTALLISNITNSSASVSWTAASPVPSNGYEYAVTTSATPPASGTATASTTASVTGLTANTTYYLHVRSNCGGSGNSSWATSASFFTGYCLASGTGANTSITNFVTTGGVTNISNATGFSAGGYGNFTGQSCSQQAGQAIGFTLTYASDPGISIYIDWNNDLDFADAGELALTSNGYLLGPATGTLTVPAGQAVGNYRMRVVLDWNATIPVACPSGINGEIEDYTFTVTCSPAQPSAIAGSLTPEVGSSQTYSVTDVAGVTETWSFPAGWVITGGQGTSSVTVTVGASNGTISVTPSIGACNGTARTTTTTIPNYRWKYISSNLGASTWTGGEARNVSITIQNTGVATWNSTYANNIGVRWNSTNTSLTGTPWNDFHSRTSVGSLAPGATGTYTLAIEAKNATAGPVYGVNLADGPYYLAFDVVSETQCWFANNTGTCGPGNSVFYSGVQTIASTPSIACTALTAFGNVCTNTTATNSFIISGVNLSNNVTVSALSGFTYSTSPSGTYTSTLTLTPSAGSLNQTVYVQLTPTAAVSYSGTIVVSSTGATSQNVSATGAGISVPTVNAGADFNLCSGQIIPLSGSTSATSSPGTASATFSAGNGSSLYSLSTITTSTLSSCPILLSVNIPAGATITGVNVSYNMIAASGAYMSEQSSYLRCTNAGGTAEASVSVGAGALGGTMTYNRNNLTIANGVTGGGTINFQLHAFRSWGGAGCEAVYNYVQNNTFTVTVSYTLNPTYSWSPATGLSASNVLNPNCSTTTTTTYTLTVTGTNGCSASDQVVATVAGGAVPTTPTAAVSGASTINVGGTAILTSTAGANTVWYTAATGGSSVGSGSPFTTPTQCTSGSVTYYAEDNNGTCASNARGAVSFTVRPMVVSNPANALICQAGGSVTLSTQLTGATGITWSPNTNLSATSGTSTVASPTTTTVYTMNASVAGCGSVSGTQTVGVIDAVAFTPTSTPTSVCAGNTAVLASNLASSGFTVSSITNSPNSPVSPTFLCNGGATPVVPLTSGNNDDGGWSSIPLGFTYNFFGSNFTTVNVGTNGVIQFGAYNSNGGFTAPFGLGDYTFTNAFPTTLEPMNIIAGGACDLTITNGTVRYWTQGIAPTRVFVLEYNVFGLGSGSNNFQIKLFETTGIVEIHVTSNTAQTGSNKVIGINNANGTIGSTAYSSANNLTNTAWKFVPGANYTFQWATAGADIAGATSTSYTTPTLNTPGTVTYSVAATNPNTQCTTTQPVSITVNALPAPPNSLGDVTACNTSGNQNLAVTTGAGETADWFSAASAGTLLLDNNTTYPTATAGTYYAAAQNTTTGCLSATRTAVTLNLNTAPTAPTASNVTYCQGVTATALTASAPSGSNTQNWYTVASGGTPLSGAPTPSTATAGTTTYYVGETSGANGCESARTAVTVTVNASPSAPTASNPGAYCQNETASALTATASGGNTLLWYTVPTGGTGSSTAITPSTATAGTTNYYVSQISASNCESARTTITVQVNPSITASVSNSASSTSACGGNAITFTATPTNGGTPSYQWYLNGNPVGGNSATYTTNQASDNAGNYSGTWNNGSNQGTGMGAWAFNAGANTGQFIGNPSNDGNGTAGIGSTAHGIFATGGAYINTTRSFTTPMQIGDELRFYWVFNWDANGGNKGFDLRSGGSTIFNVNNSGSAAITVTGGATADGGYGTTPMYVRVTRTSASQYTFTMTRRSDGSTYTTTFNSASAIDGISFYIGGQNDGSGQRNLYFNGLEMRPPQANDQIYVEMTPSAQSCLTSTAAVASSTVTLTSTASTPTVSIQTSATGGICPGTAVTFGVNSSSNMGSAPTYQWLLNGVNISGATSPTYANSSLANNDQVSLQMTSSLAPACLTSSSVTSSAITTSVNSSTSISTQPTAAAVCTGSNASFTVTAAGQGTLTYQWQKDGAPISGNNSATTNTLTLSNVSASDVANYTVIVSGTCGNSTSNAAALTLNSSTSISTQPVALTQCAGTSATYTVVASGQGSLSYQWRKDGVPISGATNATYTASNITSSDAGQYSVVVTGGCGSITSSNASLTIQPGTSIVTQPVASTICQNNTANFSVTASGQGTLAYQWKKDGVNISGATSASLTVSNAQLANAGSYTVDVTGGCGAVLSNAVSLNVNPSTSISAQPVITTPCIGQTASMSVSAAGTSPLTYQWKYGGVNIAGATSSVYNIPNVSSSNDGSYLVTVSGGCGSLNSNSVVLATENLPVVTAIATPTVVCPGQTLILSGGGAGSGATYAWDNGVTNGLAFSPSISTTYNVTGTSAAGCSGSTNVTVNLSNLTTNSTPGNGDLIWHGRTSTDYALISNWSQYNGTNLVAASAAPSTATNVIIPVNQTCVATQPAVLSGTVEVNDLIVESGASLNLGTSTLNIHGNYTNNGTLTPGTGTVAFVGTSGNQTITKTGGETFTNMTVNKAAGNVVLANNATITGGLTLTNGLVELGTNNLIMGGATINGGSSASYVKTASSGVLSRNVGGSAVNFPVGNVSYNPAMVTNTGTADNFSLRVIDNVTADGTGVGTQTTQAVVNRTWMVNEATTGGSNVTLRLYWNGTGEEINAFSPASAFMAHYISSSGMWDNIGGTVSVSGYVEASGITSFSPFTISSSPVFAPLPIELVSFQANCAGDDKINVTWTTASEHNTSHYVVEHSRNGNDWEALTILAAAGNSTSLLDYTYVHENPNAGTNYYRLTQYDNDGEFEQFNAVAVDCDNLNSNTTLSTYPNPSEGSFYISLFTEEMDGAGVITITDTKGAVVHTQDVNIQKGNSVFYMNNMQVAPGMYYIQVTNGNKSTDIVKHSLR